MNTVELIRKSASDLKVKRDEANELEQALRKAVSEYVIPLLRNIDLFKLKLVGMQIEVVPLSTAAWTHLHTIFQALSTVEGKEITQLHFTDAGTEWYLFDYGKLMNNLGLCTLGSKVLEAAKASKLPLYFYEYREELNKRRSQYHARIKESEEAIATYPFRRD